MKKDSKKTADTKNTKLSKKTLPNLDKVIEKVRTDITMNKVLIEYLKTTKLDLSKEAKAQLDMKIQALQRDIMFNEGFIIYAENL